MLGWSDRLAILTGIAKAVHFLHTGIIPGFYSNRLRANNILLNEHRMGKLSDYGLSVVAQDIDKDKVMYSGTHCLLGCSILKYCRMLTTVSCFLD